MTKTYASRDGKLGSHGNKTSWPHRPDSERWPELSLRKVPADSVPYGESISRNGHTVWAGFHGDQFVCCGATHDEARAKYIDWDVRQKRGQCEQDKGTATG
jgi:hypothetical protein